MDKKIRFSTKCIHSGEYIDKETGAVNTPIFQSSTFVLSDEDYKKILDGKAREAWIYSRYGNPTRRAVEEKIRELCNGEDAILFSSGMAAISTTLLTFLKEGDEIITTLDLYGGTQSFIKNELPKFGIVVKYVDQTKPEEIKKVATDKTKLLYFETLSNPLLKILDVDEVVKIAKDIGVPVVVDNTFLTPYNLTPLDRGVDIEIHSVTKYLNGHSDVVGGVVVGSKNYMDMIWERMIRYGGSMDPASSFLLERGLKTLSLRMERHNVNALRIATFLSTHEKVRNVIYPTLDNYPQVLSSIKYLTKGAGGMVSFEVKGNDEDGLKFMRNLKIIKEATSLGGVESLVSMPFNTSHASLTEEEREKIGIGPGFIRLSVGIEDVDDLMWDIDQALKNI